MRKTLFLMMILLAMGWLVGGCSSDETAANDPLPEIDESDVAGQAGYMSVAVVSMAPVALNFSGKADETDGDYVYTFGLGSDLTGSVMLHFEQGGAPSGYDVADYAQAWTADGAPVVFVPELDIDIPGDPVPWYLAFNLESTIDQGAGTAVVNGSGSLDVGDYAATWSVTDLAVSRAADYPQSGTFTFTNEGITGTVTFDGDNTATVEVGALSWTVNLGTGSITEL